jgi:hypothetical protein
MNAVSKPHLDTQDSRDFGGVVMIAGVALGLFWSAGVAAFLLGYLGAALLDMPPQAIAGIAFISIAPAITFAAGGWIAREMLQFARTARLLDYSARRLAAPVANAKADARSVADAISEQVARLNRDAEGALGRLSDMEKVLTDYAKAVHEASQQARGEVDSLIEELRRERSALGDLADHLRTEGTKISDTIDRQTEIVSTATRVAANQAEEGRAALEKSASSMQEAAGSAQRAAEKAALAIDEQLRDMQALVAALEDRGGRLEDIARIHSENVKIVQQTTHELNLAADAGADSMKSASEAAIEQARRVGEIIEKETARAVERGMEEIERLRRAAQAAREAAESAGLVLEANADAVIERVHAANAAMLDAENAGRTMSSRGRPEPSLPPNRRAALEDDWREERSHKSRRPSDAPDFDVDAPPQRDAGRRASRFFGGGQQQPPSRSFEGAGLDDVVANGRRGSGRSRAEDEDYAAGAGRGQEEDGGEWRWRDLLKNIDENPSGMLAGEAVVSGLRRAGVDPARALDPDMTARVARARRRSGSGEARALVLDGALNDVRRTSAALAADPTLRGRAEEFVGEHARLVRRAIDENDAGLLSSLLDSDMGRAYLLLDAALTDG